MNGKSTVALFIETLAIKFKLVGHLSSDGQLQLYAALPKFWTRISYAFTIAIKTPANKRVILYDFEAMNGNGLPLTIKQNRIEL